MKRSNDRILTTHAGSLPRPEELVRLYRDNAPDGDLQPRLKAAVADVVQQQRKAGVDIVGDGEFGKATRAAVDYGAWWSYIYDRMEGFEVRSGAVYGETFGPMNSQDWATFREFYESGAPMSGGSNAPASTSATAGSRLARARLQGTCSVFGACAGKPRHREPQVRPARQRCRRRLHACGFSRDASDYPERVLPDCRGLHLGAG